MTARQVLVANFIRGLEFLQEVDNRSIEDARLINRRILINSGRFEIDVQQDAIIGLMYRAEHGIIQNFGVKRSRFNIGLKRWLEVTKEWARIVKPGLSDSEITKFQSAVFFKKKALPASAFALRPRPWIKRGTDIAEERLNEVFNINEYLNALLNESLQLLAA